MRDGDDQNMLSARGIIVRFKYLLCPFEIEVQNIP